MEVEEEVDEDEEVVRFFFLRTSGALLEKAAKGAASWRGACGSIGIAGCTAVKAGALSCARIVQHPLQERDKSAEQVA